MGRGGRDGEYIYRSSSLILNADEVKGRSYANALFGGGNYALVHVIC